MTSSPLARGFRQETDERDDRHTLDVRLGASPLRRGIKSKFYGIGPVLNQGATNTCVGHSCYQLLRSEPVVMAPGGLVTPFSIYEEARKIDEFPDDAEGTSIRAAMKVLQSRGLVREYWWARSTEQMVDYLLNIGPLVAGTKWRAGMDFVSSDGFISNEGSEGDIGHAYLLFGVDTDKQAFMLVNSYGEGWGRSGTAWVPISAFDKLLAEGGVACAAREVI